VRTHPQRPGRGVPDGHGLVEDLPQSCVGRELLVLDDPDGGELTGQLGVERFGRLQLDQGSSIS
jgi:hypothetical protein